MIREASFRNFKALADVRVRLGEVTCLVGANASGKTSVLEGIECLSRLARPVTQKDASTLFPSVFHGRFYPSLLHTIGTSVMELTLEAGWTLEASFRLDLSKRPQWSERAKFVDGDQTITIETNNFQHAVLFHNALDKTCLAAAIRLRLNPDQLREPSASETEIPSLSPDGTGLASVISYLLSDRSPAIDEIEAGLARILPGAKRLRSKPTLVPRTDREIIRINDEAITRTLERKVPGHRLELLGRGGEGIPADHLSEGTLLVIGILTVLHTNPGLKLLLLDDIDRGLHPRAQRTLVELLLKIRAERPELQIVCTTHSPFVLDLLAPEDVRVMKRDAEGLAHCQELTEHPEWPKWKETLKAGEFWSFVGEDWVG